MAREVKYRGDVTGASLNFTVRNSAGLLWNTTTTDFDKQTAPVATDWALRITALAESSGSDALAGTYFYDGTWPNIGDAQMVNGWYTVDIFNGALVGSTLIGTQYGYWDGTHFHLDAANVKEVGDTAQTAGRDLGTVLPATALNNAPAVATDGTLKVDVTNWKTATAPAMTGDAYARLAATPPTAAQIATSIWQDLVAGTDFTTAASVGVLINALAKAAGATGTVAATNAAGAAGGLPVLPASLKLPTTTATGDATDVLALGVLLAEICGIECWGDGAIGATTLQGVYRYGGIYNSKPYFTQLNSASYLWWGRNPANDADAWRLGLTLGATTDYLYYVPEVYEFTYENFIGTGTGTGNVEFLLNPYIGSADTGIGAPGPGNSGGALLVDSTIGNYAIQGTPQSGSPNKLLQDAATAAAQPDIDTLTIDSVSKKVVLSTTYGIMGVLFNSTVATVSTVMAAAFKKLFNIATPANTVNDLAKEASVGAIQTILTGITSLAEWLGLIAGKQVGNSAARTELRATGAGSGTFDETTDSQEAIRDRGDAAYLTATSTAASNMPSDGNFLSTAQKASLTAAGSGSWYSAPSIPTPPTVEQIDTQLSDTHGDGQWDATAAGLSESDVRHAVGLATANLDMQLLPLASLPSLGAGAWTVTITVTDGTNPVANALVRMTAGATTRAGSTNASGVVVFGLDGATWAVVITHSSYTFTPTTLSVSANTTQTYAMTAVTIPTSNPGFVTGYLYCYDKSGVIKSAATIELHLVSVAGSGVSIDTTVRTGTSDVNGLVTFTNLSVGATYRLRRETTGKWRDIAISADATSPVALPNSIG
jgi:hypothetical protein